MQYGFGVDLGGTTVKLAFFNMEGTMLEKWEIPTVTADNGTQILPDIADSILSYVQRSSISREQILGIGIGVPGPVDDQGVVNKCLNLGWGALHVANALSDLTGFPVKAGNDATAAAMGEYWKGSAKGCKNMLLVTLGTGVGGGIIINGQPVYGTHGSAGEIGHIVLDRNETESCTCGKYGCAEQYCSATGIVRIAKKYLKDNPAPSSLRDLPLFTCKDIFDAATAADEAAVCILEQFFDRTAEFLADVCCVLDPDMVVIGGGVSKAGNILLQGIQKHFPKYIFHSIANVRFSIATLGNDAGVYGAFKLLLQSL